MLVVDLELVVEAWQCPRSRLTKDEEEEKEDEEQKEKAIILIKSRDLCLAGGEQLI